MTQQKSILGSLTVSQKRALLAAVVLLPLCGWVAFRTSCVGATPGGEQLPPPSEVAALPPALPVVADAGAPPPAATVVPTTATIVFATVPSTAHATVSWGKKKLGKIEPGKPLVVVRPRDSGPLDVTVSAQGFLPVHTRAYTFNDGKVLVKLTPPEQMNTLLGYRVPVDAGIPVSLDEEPPPPPGPAMPPTLW